ncbi:AAA family ATPase, partial [candidate division KSB1 bacterium]|nr:AAA family ATPase [candidate division KSB1 bacterium]
RYHVTGLEASEAASYINHHLKVAGRVDSIFSDDVVQEIYQQAKGIPRVINNLCYDCLLEIHREGKNVVDTATLERVMLRWQ